LQSRLALSGGIFMKELVTRDADDVGELRWYMLEILRWQYQVPLPLRHSST
jgi:hypothetical protein